MTQMVKPASTARMRSIIGSGDAGERDTGQAVMLNPDISTIL
jgi:hypothetical protein